MDQKKNYQDNKKPYYPAATKNHPPAKPSISKDLINSQRTRYTKGHQNQMINASRRTETYTKDKTVIVTEVVNVVDFNGDNFSYEFGGNKNLKKDENH